MKTPPAPIGVLVIYFIAPAVMLQGTWKVELTANRTILPMIVLAVCSAIALSAYYIGRRVWGEMANLFGATSGSLNAGYFGIPVVVALLGKQFFPVAVVATFGSIIYENSLKYYLLLSFHLIFPHLFSWKMLMRLER